MISSEVKKVVDELTRLKGISSSSVYTTARELVFEFLKNNVQGLETNERFEFLYLYGQKLNVKLYEIVNTINGTDKIVNKWLILSQSVATLRKLKSELTKNGITENIIKEFTNLKIEIMNKVKILYEGDTLSIFPDKEERIKDSIDKIVDLLNGIGSTDVKIIKPIDAIIAKISINNFREVVQKIADCFDNDSRIKINDHSDYKDAMIIFQK